MTTKKLQKGSTKGKAEGSKKTRGAAPADDPRQRAEELIATNKYGTR